MKEQCASFYTRHIRPENNLSQRLSVALFDVTYLTLLNPLAREILIQYHRSSFSSITEIANLLVAASLLTLAKSLSTDAKI